MPAAWSETWRILCLLLCVLTLLYPPGCAAQLGFSYLWSWPKAAGFPASFTWVCSCEHLQTCHTQTHMEISLPPCLPQKGESFQAKRNLWGYQQCRLIDIFSVSLLMPSGIVKVERNDNFPAWLPISRAAGQWQNIWSSVRAPLKH